MEVFEAVIPRKGSDTCKGVDVWKSRRHSQQHIIPGAEADDVRIETRLVVAKGEGGVGEGWVGSLGFADANYFM